MEIIIGKTAGFCFGVANAVNKTNNLLDNENNDVYCLGELVHNIQVNEELQKKGLNIIEDINDASKNLIIRSHGAKKQIYNKAKEMGLNVIDLTCPKVLRIHDIAEKYSKKGYYVFLIGNKNHPEINATISYCGKYSKIIEKEEDIDEAIIDLNKSMIDKLLIIVQTTFSVEKFNRIVLDIEKEIKKEENKINIEIKNTICDATKIRQNETEEISSKVDMMIIVGGKHSSNTNKLFEISKKNCENSVLIEEAEELDVNIVKKHNKIGIMAGASTPKKSIDAVVEKLKGI